MRIKNCIEIHLMHVSPLRLFVHLVCTCFFFSSPDGRNREGEEQQRDKVGEAKEKGRWAVSEGVGFVIVTGEW